MEYVNFTVSIPVFDYLWLENLSKKSHTTKNEIIISQLNSLKTNSSKYFTTLKNAGFNNNYNKNVEQKKPYQKG